MGKKQLLSLMYAVACFTAQDVWDNRCDVGCKHGGWESGKFQPPNKCLCIDVRNVEDMTKRRIVINSTKPLKKKESEPRIEFVHIPRFDE